MEACNCHNNTYIVFYLHFQIPIFIMHFKEQDIDAINGSETKFAVLKEFLKKERA